MSRFFYVVSVAIAIVGCASKKQVTSHTEDGSSIESAVAAKNRDSEYEWVGEHYPDGRITAQAVISKGRKNYDVLSVQLADGSIKRVYFYHPIP